jgi:hypothetical protein
VHLAMWYTRCCLPLNTHGVGIPEYLSLARQGMHFAAQYPACTFLYQRFAFALTKPHTELEAVVVRYSSTYETFIHYPLPG